MRAEAPMCEERDLASQYIPVSRSGDVEITREERALHVAVVRTVPAQQVAEHRHGAKRGRQRRAVLP